ncbi:hypothetical protein OIU79_013590 [Salix purpurea]|uniref:Uncharacterized protein n=1 Tax=Salix purpurea TaxID=77065 RepID=A0A9Q0SVU4_SALPP|nr:hypothetical protein OIU79_013590 [Salix purpurea]
MQSHSLTATPRPHSIFSQASLRQPATLTLLIPMVIPLLLTAPFPPSTMNSSLPRQHQLSSLVNGHQQPPLASIGDRLLLHNTLNHMKKGRRGC